MRIFGQVAGKGSGMLISKSNDLFQSDELKALTEEQKAFIQSHLEGYENHLEQVQKMANVGTWSYDFKSKEKVWSKQLFEVFDQPESSEIPSFENVISFVHPHDRHHYKVTIYGALRERTPYTIDYRILVNDKVRYLYEKGEAFINPATKTCRLWGIVQDITETRRLKNKLIETTNHFKEFRDQMDIGVWSMDLIQDKILYCSWGFETITGYSWTSFLTKEIKWVDLVVAEDRRIFQTFRDKIFNGESVDVNYRILHKSGKIVWINERSNPQINDQGQVFRINGMIKEITEVKAGYLSENDEGTGLPNRTELMERLKILVDQNQSFSLFSLKVDRLTYVSDIFGQSKGDRALVKMAEVLVDLFTNHAEIYHIRRNEFIFIKNDGFDAASVHSFCECLIDAIQVPIKVDQHEFYFSGYAGSSVYPRDGQTSETILKSAQKALYTDVEKSRMPFIE